jgi:hypothetical protein
MDKFIKIVRTITITSIMIFVASFIIKYKEIFTTGEILSIIVLGVYSTLYLSNNLDQELEQEKE